MRTVLSAARAAAPLALAVVLAVPIPASAQLTLGEVMKDTVLANGLHVIVVPNPTIPLVTMQVTVRNGAFTQQSRTDEGLPHLLEHMLFRSFGSADGFSGQASRLDAYYNGTTSTETVTYYITLPSENLDRGIRLMADLMRSPRFRDGELTSEKQVVRGEMERLASDPSYLLNAAVDQRLWGTGMPRRNTIGNLQSVNNATSNRLKEMYDRFYVPNNAAIVLTGDVDAGTAFASAGQHFSGWSRSADPFAGLELEPLPALQSHQQVVVDADASDVTIVLRWQGPGVADAPAATIAADVFSSLVNDPLSELQARLVDSGLFRSVTMGYETLAHNGPITLQALTTADQLLEASAALRAELDLFSQPGYVTGQALEIAQKRRDVDWAMFMDTPSGLAHFVGDLWSVAGMDYTRNYLASMRAQTPADLTDYAATYLTGRPRVMGIMISPETRALLGSNLPNAIAHWRR
jgi:zinc protease